MESYNPPTVTIPYRYRFPGATEALASITANRTPAKVRRLARVQGFTSRMSRPSDRVASEPSATPTSVDPSIKPTDHTIAPCRARIFAQLLDMSLALAPVFSLIMLDKAGTFDVEQVPVAVRTLAISFIFLMQPFALTVSNGRTPGKLLFNLRVVRASGSRMSMLHALKRETIFKWWHGHFFAIGDISMMYLDGLHRSEHDLSAKTFVVIDRRVRLDD